MQNFSVKRAIITVTIFGLFGIFLFLYVTFRSLSIPVVPLVVRSDNLVPVHTVIGTSVQGRTIDAYTYGSGKTMLVFVGGIHGGYEWNTVVLAYDLMDYLQANLESIPKNITVVIIPSANPDGVYKVVGKEGRFTSTDVPTNTSTVPGRFNAHEVDLNRNFDCKWQAESMWRNKTESAGTTVFSEPEVVAIRDFMLKQKPVAVVFWHSQSGNVYASQCKNGILPGTLDLMNTYAKGSGYHALKTFDAYETTGGADDWLATVGIPAITVELTTHETIEWERNLLGVKALFEYYSVR